MNTRTSSEGELLHNNEQQPNCLRHGEGEGKGHMPTHRVLADIARARQSRDIKVHTGSVPSLFVLMREPTLTILPQTVVAVMAGTRRVPTSVLEGRAGCLYGEG